MKSSALKILLLTALLPTSFQVIFSNNAAAKTDEIKFGVTHKVTLQISAQVYDGNEDENRIPIETEIYFLPASVVQILREEKFEPVDEVSGAAAADDESYLSAVAEAFSRNHEESALICQLIQDALETHKITKFRTDIYGRGQAKVKSGSFYLFAVERIGDEMFVWNLPVDLTFGNQPIELDQHNAEAVIDVQ